MGVEVMTQECDVTVERADSFRSDGQQLFLSEGDKVIAVFAVGKWISAIKLED